MEAAMYPDPLVAMYSGPFLTSARLRVEDDAPDDSIYASSPSVTDPYAIAYLRGGEKAVLVLQLLDLVQRGYLEVAETRKWLSTQRRLSIAQDHPPLETLTRSQQILVGCFSTPRGAGEILDLVLPESLQSACAGYEAEFERGGLITERSAGRPWRARVRARWGDMSIAAGIVALFAVITLSGMLSVAVKRHPEGDRWRH
jgi:uncharacterized protein (TIGR04222 family)